MPVLPTTSTLGFSVMAKGRHGTTLRITSRMIFMLLGLRRILWVRRNGQTRWKVSWGTSQISALNKWVTKWQSYKWMQVQGRNASYYLLTSRWRSTLCGTFGLWSWPSLSTKTGSPTFFQTVWRRGSPTLWVSVQFQFFTKVNWTIIAHRCSLRSLLCRKQGSSGSVLHVQWYIFWLCQQSPDLWKWEEAQVSNMLHS